MKMVEIYVTASGAICVDNTRITDRSTKPWGGSDILFEATVAEDQVIPALIANGYLGNLGKIDTEPYLSLAKPYLPLAEKGSR